jgi:hypothetical protein
MLLPEKVMTEEDWRDSPFNDASKYENVFTDILDVRLHYPRLYLLAQVWTKFLNANR